MPDQYLLFALPKVPCFSHYLLLSHVQDSDSHISCPFQINLPLNIFLSTEERKCNRSNHFRLWIYKTNTASVIHIDAFICVLWLFNLYLIEATVEAVGGPHN